LGFRRAAKNAVNCSAVSAGLTPGEWQAADFSRPAEGDAVEEFEGGVDLSVTGIGQLFDLDLVQQEGTHLGRTQFLRGTHVEGREFAAVQQIVPPRAGTQPPQLQVLLHPIA
jgi:hypothetical protein